MVKKRVIPCLDVRNGRVVKGKRFSEVREVDDPIELAKFYNESGADELVLYDIAASLEGRSIFTKLLSEVAEEISVPLTVGGGISHVEDFERVLNSGADKVSINSAVISNPKIIGQAAKVFGSQRIVFSMDVKKIGDNYRVYSKGGSEDTGIDAIEWAKFGEQEGAGELVVNSIDTDGVKEGFDMPLLNIIASEMSIPVIASGGAGSMQHFLELFSNPKLNAGLAASIFHYKEVMIPELKRFLADNGIEVNL
ncbi:MAG: imidazole glycerol phosphate synthase subunit HisF [Ruminococcaceae bacterium]|nr:imidazole glycerol phosphate synthase subunit HisF [Oscillospiraceae bacterium]